MPHEPPSRPASEAKPAEGGDGGVSAEALQKGHEPLQTNTRALRLAAFLFVLTAVVLHTDLWVLERYYVSQPRPTDVSASVATPLATNLRSPLEPMPTHNELDWQDLVRLRQDEDARFAAVGWPLDSATGEPIVPASVIAAVASRAGIAAVKLPPPLFPPPLAPVRAGPGEPLTRANVFPPVGAAAEAEELPESIWRPPPGPHDVKDLPTESGPPGRGDELVPGGPRQ